jgi:hypothetical protein
MTSAEVEDRGIFFAYLSYMRTRRRKMSPPFSKPLDCMMQMSVNIIHASTFP